MTPIFGTKDCCYLSNGLRGSEWNSENASAGFLCYSLLTVRSLVPSLVQVSDWFGIIADGLVYGFPQPPTGSPGRCSDKGSAHFVSFRKREWICKYQKGPSHKVRLFLLLGCKILRSGLMFDGAFKDHFASYSLKYSWFVAVVKVLCRSCSLVFVLWKYIRVVLI